MILSVLQEEEQVPDIPKKLQHSSKKNSVLNLKCLTYLLFLKSFCKKNFIMNISNTVLAYKLISACASFPKPCRWLCFCVTKEVVVLTEHLKMTFWWCMLICCRVTIAPIVKCQEKSLYRSQCWFVILALFIYLLTCLFEFLLARGTYYQTEKDSLTWYFLILVVNIVISSLPEDFNVCITFGQR